VRYLERIILLSSSKALLSVLPEKSTAPPVSQNDRHCFMLFFLVAAKAGADAILFFFSKSQENLKVVSFFGSNKK
jgi:hypothetical protein